LGLFCDEVSLPIALQSFASPPNNQHHVAIRNHLRCLDIRWSILVSWKPEGAAVTFLVIHDLAVAGNRDHPSGESWTAATRRSPSLAPLEPKSPTSAKACLGSRQSAAGHGCSSVQSLSAFAVPRAGAVTRLGVGASLWAFLCSASSCLVNPELLVLILSGVLAMSKRARWPRL